jgi:hypothetical protein
VRYFGQLLDFDIQIEVIMDFTLEFLGVLFDILLQNLRLLKNILLQGAIILSQLRSDLL